MTARGRRSAGWDVLALLLVVLASVAALPATASAQPPTTAVLLRTVPAIAGVPLTADGVTAVTAVDGRAQLAVRETRDLETRLQVPLTEVTPDLRVERDRVVGSGRDAVNGVQVGLRTQRRVQLRFTGPDQEAVAPSRITRVELRSNAGEAVVLEGDAVGQPVWLAASRTQQAPSGLVSKDLYWTVSHVVVDAAEVVNKGQQKFVPNVERDWLVRLLFYQVRVQGVDALFGGPAGNGIELVRPDGTLLTAPFSNGGVDLANVPRGNYNARVYGSGMSFVRPVGISKDQELVLEVITPIDLVLVATFLAALAIGLVVVGRRKRLRDWLRRRRRRVTEEPASARSAGARAGRLSRTPIAVLIALVAGISAIPEGPRIALQAAVRHDPRAAAVDAGGVVAPLFAYYYIWFNPDSWNRAKRDYPLLGRYSSKDADVMRVHVRQAKAAGLSGFLVSWKHTDFLDPRLDQLVEIARQQDFALGIVYQGLDFARNPQPAYQVSADLRYFAARYARDPVFGLLGQPVVVVTGTERYSLEEMSEITGGVRDELHVLASAKNVEEYERTAALVDGDAYYWSSGDPARSGYGAKLREMGAAVHARHGLWFAPATAGFDARDLNGHRVIDRRAGDTLRSAVSAARTSNPDAVAVISWNEFSENSHVEPSVLHGTTALEALAQLTGRDLDPAMVRAESDEPGPEASGVPSWVALTITALLASLLLVVARRRRRPNRPPTS